MQLFRARTVLLRWMIFIHAINIVLNDIFKKYHTIRRWWVKPHLKNNVRNEYGGFVTMYCYFKENDHEEFKNFVGVTVDQFNELLELVEPKLRKRSWRPGVLCPELRLAVVLK